MEYGGKQKSTEKKTEDAFRCSNAIRFCVFDEAGSAGTATPPNWFCFAFKMFS